MGWPFRRGLSDERKGQDNACRGFLTRGDWLGRARWPSSAAASTSGWRAREPKREAWLAHALMKAAPARRAGRIPAAAADDCRFSVSYASRPSRLTGLS